MSKLLLKTILLLLLMVLSGCGVLNSAPPQETGHFFINPYTDFDDIGRVVPPQSTYCARCEGHATVLSVIL